MPDHLHWLVQISALTLLSSVVRNVKSGSSRRIRQVTGLADSVWQAGFYDHAMRDDEDPLATARYIVANPVRAGLVGAVGDYALWDAVWV